MKCREVRMLIALGLILVFSLIWMNAMKKTEDWSPNQTNQNTYGPYSLRIIGDPVLAQPYMAYARNFLFSLKRRMSLQRISEGQDQMMFPGGVRLRVKSFRGGDLIEIETTAVAPTAVCTITFKDMPTKVPAMTWYKKEHPPFVNSPMDTLQLVLTKLNKKQEEGVDYIKTYYTVDLSKCPKCKPLSWNIFPIERGILTAFNFKTPYEPRHWTSPWSHTGPPPYDQPNNHQIYSLTPFGYAEILYFGTDEKGTFIIWKAYTEAPDTSETGLAVLLIQAMVYDPTGQIIVCSQQAKLDVDCCQKPPDKRIMQMWWASNAESYHPGYGGWMYYEGAQIWRIPPLINISIFVEQAGWFGRFLLCIPEVNGCCMPVTWILKGPGKLIPQDVYGKSARYIAPEGGIDCKTDLSVTAIDNCGTLFKLMTYNCCNQPGGGPSPVSLSYTSLQMTCGTGQDITVVGGCPPYSWVCTSGTFGSSGSSYKGPETTLAFNAPATNPNCSNNPTVTVTDCCGNSASVTFVANCVTGPSEAYYITTWLGVWMATCGAVVCKGVFYCDFVGEHKYYNCDGTYNSEVQFDQIYIASPDACKGGALCADDMPGDPCAYVEEGGVTSICVPHSISESCGFTKDVRTDAQKAAGCCPINPNTGLPF